jgi:hypothetical protein
MTGAREEFIPVASRAFVLETLSQLQSHRAIHAQGIGFREVFVRDEPPVPLAASGITRAELRPILDANVIALYYPGSQPAHIRGGFALPLPDVGFVYGEESDGVVVALGIGLVGSGVGEVAQVASLSGRFDLLFVDWIRGIVIELGDEAGFRAWLDAIIYRDPNPGPDTW